MENCNMLGEIQIGFRKGHRAAENLGVLTTIIQMQRREKKKINIAFLDVSKAYDRVCRKTLCSKLRARGFSEGMIQMLLAIYANPASILIFQDISKGPLFMEIGLRQGCVLSPILFAIYIADLGDELIASGYGVRINNMIIPGMMFADDIMLAGDDEAMRHLCNIAMNYAIRNKLEFSGEKSMIIPLHRDVSEENKWSVGPIPKKNKTHLRRQASEKKEGKYLGVTFAKT